MKYTFLIYSNPEQVPTRGSEKFGKFMTAFFAANERMKADGVLCEGDGLQGVDTATSLRIRSGKVETTDGPFAETREYLGGYYVIDVSDLDAALKYAELIPSAQFGTIEIRPVMDYKPTA